MPESVIDHQRVRQLVDGRDAQVVEVLPRSQYDHARLPGAVHVPLEDFDVSPLAHDRPVVVYCNDFL